jgi:phosphosulfolactate synthase (CoM biosynthesis protein A)
MKGRQMKFKAGQYVRHSKYGWGTVIECDRERTVVYFRTIGVKRMTTSLANFVVGGEALKKKAAVV